MPALPANSLWWQHSPDFRPIQNRNTDAYPHTHSIASITHADTFSHIYSIASITYADTFSHTYSIASITHADAYTHIYSIAYANTHSERHHWAVDLALPGQ